MTWRCVVINLPMSSDLAQSTRRPVVLPRISFPLVAEVTRMYRLKHPFLKGRCGKEVAQIMGLWSSPTMQVHVLATVTSNAKMIIVSFTSPIGTIQILRGCKHSLFSCRMSTNSNACHRFTYTCNFSDAVVQACNGDPITLCASSNLF